MRAVARVCFTHRWIVLGVWLVAVVFTTGLSGGLGTKFTTKFSQPDTPSAAALTLLQDNFPAASGSTDQIVVQTTSGTVQDPAVRQRVSQMLAEVQTLPHVRSVASPYATSGPAGGTQVSRDGTIAFATVTFDGQSQDIPKGAVTRVITTAEAAGDAQVRVALAGQDIENAEKQSNSVSTVLGVVFALVVLGIAFGALFAAFLPIITALIAIAIGYALTGLLTHAMAIPSFATILGVLIGLGVGVDYALFITTRHRAALRAGRSVEDAAVEAVNTAGRAVFFAGLTVCIALLGQFALGLSFLYGTAVSASLTVVFTMLASLTLLPALLGFFGMRVLSRRQRSALRASGPVDEANTGRWYQWASMIERRHKGPAALALLVVVVIAAPIFTLRLGLDDAGSDPSGTTTKQAYTMLAEGFGPGFSGPFQLVAKLPSPGSIGAFRSVTEALASEPGVARVTPPVGSPNGRVALADLYPTTSPQAAQTTVLLHRLRNVELPKVAATTGIPVLVGGATATNADFAHLLASKLILFVAVVVLLGFILLMAVFRSLLVPLVASVMNLLSVGAALGLMNVVFEWGWGHSLFRISEKTPIEVFIPVIMVSILFGLSMDYEVFLVSRMHEEWVKTRDNSRAVTLGQAATGRVITAAAAIMILVFVSFALGDDIVIKQFGLGLAGAIVIDAFIVRTVLVPSLMHLFGPRNWWLPAWLDRVLPQLNVEGADRTDPLLPPAEPVLVPPRR